MQDTEVADDDNIQKKILECIYLDFLFIKLVQLQKLNTQQK